MQDFNLSRTVIIVKFIPTIERLLDRVKQIYKHDISQRYNNITIINRLDKSINTVSKLNSSLTLTDITKDATTKLLLTNTETRMFINKILDGIKDDFDNILSDNVYDNIYETKTYIYATKKIHKEFVNEFISVHKNCDKIDTRLKELFVDKIFGDFIKSSEIKSSMDNIITNFTNLNIEFREFDYTWDLYSIFVNKLLTVYDKQTINKILSINEQNKDYLLNKMSIRTKLKKVHENINPQLKTYTLIPVSNIMTIEEISKLLFAKTTGNLDTFINICKTKKKDLIIVKKYLNRGVAYDILTLLDFTKSKNYSVINSADDGITTETINRFNNIKYIGDGNNDITEFKSEYKYYYYNNNAEILVLEELYVGKYQILSNGIKPPNEAYIKREGSPLDLALDLDLNATQETTRETTRETTKDADQPSRIDNYNNYVNKGILKNMFLKTLPNIAEIQKISSIDPNYLRHNIYREIIKKYKQLDNKPIKSIFGFSRLIHNEQFGQVLETVVLEYYYNYMKKLHTVKNIPKSEVYSSFITVLSIYYRDFTKKIHDEFMKEITNIVDDKLFYKSPEKIKAGLLAKFEKIIMDILNVIITNDTNLFQTLDYKIKLLNYMN